MSYAVWSARLLAIVQCMKEASCGVPTMIAKIDGDIPGLVIEVSLDDGKENSIMLMEQGFTIRKLDSSVGTVTIFVDRDFDGAVDAVKVSHLTTPMSNEWEAEDLSSEDKEKFQKQFDQVVAVAHRTYIKKTITRNSKQI